jgi:hypothetical protein
MMRLGQIEHHIGSILKERVMIRYIFGFIHDQLMRNHSLYAGVGAVLINVLLVYGLDCLLAVNLTGLDVAQG